MSSSLQKSKIQRLTAVLGEIRDHCLQSDEPMSDRIPHRLLDRLVVAGRQIGPAFEEEVRDQINTFTNHGGSAPWLLQTEVGPSVFAGFIKPMKSSSTGCFEYVVYSRLEIENKVADLKSNAIPVLALHRSPGLQSDKVVAVFPENLCFGTYRPTVDDPIYYLVDGFGKRTESVSIPVLFGSTATGSFTSLKKSLGDAKRRLSNINRLATHWLWLHEYMHRLGSLPYVNFPILKRRNFCAGFEETRADCLAIEYAAKLGTEFGRLLSEFILFERLLRYPSEVSPEKYCEDYDSIGSLTLLGFLQSKGAVSINEKRIDLSANWLDAVEEFSRAIEKVEQGVRSNLPVDHYQTQHELETAREPIKKFVTQFVDLTGNERNSLTRRFFGNVAAKLAKASS